MVLQVWPPDLLYQNLGMDSSLCFPKSLVFLCPLELEEYWAGLLCF